MIGVKRMVVETFLFSRIKFLAKCNTNLSLSQIILPLDSIKNSLVAVLVTHFLPGIRLIMKVQLQLTL